MNDAELAQAALEGMDAFVQVFVDAIRKAIGGDLTAENMQELNADQMTLLCWDTLHEEVMDGGFIQLIHNGYGMFIFKNPFAKALNKMWGMKPLAKMLYEVHTLWLENREALERDCSDEEFMALFEQYPQFDDYDDFFIEHEEVMDGGFVQLIHNGYGPFIFKNPFAKAVKLWGMRELSKLVYDAHTLWLKHRDVIERELNEVEFMALFEQLPEFDDLDDAFIESEEEWTSMIAHYIDEHIERFALIEN